MRQVRVGASGEVTAGAKPLAGVGITAFKLFMNKTVSIVLFLGGLIVLIYGIGSSNSTASGISKFFTGAPTDKAMWLVVGGAVASIAGLVLTMRGSKGT